MKQFKASNTLSDSEKDALQKALSITGKNLEEEEGLALDTDKNFTEKSKHTVLLSGDDTSAVVSSAVGSYVSDHKKIGTKGIKLDITGAVLAKVEKQLQNPIDNFNVVGAWVYVADATKIGNLNFRLYNTDTSFLYNKSQLDSDGQLIVNGWNLLRFRVNSVASYTHSAKAITSVAFLPQTTDTTSVVLGGIWVESFEKAKMLFVHDGGYKDFFTVGHRGYYDLEARGMPVTIATIPKPIFENNPNFMSPAKLYELSMRNNNEVSIHSYAAQDELATMTPEEVYNESYNAIDLLRKNGYDPVWRAAWYRANVPSGMGAKNIFRSFVRHGGYSKIELIEGFPFVANYNARRWQLHGKTNQQVDEVFAMLKKTRGVVIFYTHNVNDGMTGDIAVADWEYFLQKLDVALAEGWIEGSTYKMLSNPYFKENPDYVMTKSIPK